ncbi:MAG: response regulator [Thiothrix sp.]
MQGILFVLLLLFGASAMAAEPPILELADTAQLPIQVTEMELLRDPGGTMTLAQVRSPANAQGFVRAPPGVPNLGTSSDAFWARFAVHNATAEPASLLLVLAEPRMSHVAFWSLDASGKTTAQRRDGRWALPAERDRSHRWFLFDLPLAAHETSTVYVRFASDKGLLLDLRLTDRARLAADDRISYGGLALFFGAMLFMFAYNLVLFLQLREAAYFWLCCMIPGVLLWMADREGLLTTLLWEIWPDPWRGNMIGGALAMVGVIMFPVGFLRLRVYTPWLARVHLSLAVSVVVNFGIIDHWNPYIGSMLSHVTILLAGVISLLTGALALRWQPRTAAFYLLAWAPLLVAIILLALTNYNYAISPPQFSARILIYGALLLMLLLLSLAEANRINDLRQQAERARTILARNEEHLTELVEARTRELATERDRAETANRAKTRFLANMSHELRTPLNAMLGYANLLQRAPSLGSEERTHCGVIGRSGLHLLRLIDELLEVAEIEHGRLRLLIGDVALAPMLSDLAETTRQQAVAKGLMFEEHVAPDLPQTIRTDGQRLRQVLQNLLDNAVKYTAAGQVRLSVAVDRSSPDAPGSVLHFAVTDTGCGIPAEEHERLFTPFEQYHPGQQGKGLGLAICRELSTLLGGVLTLESSPGYGSTFSFRIPLQPVSTPVGDTSYPASQAVVSGYTGPIRRVLVIDDNEANRLVLRDLLQSLGFVVDIAEDAKTALVCAHLQPPDLVIADLRMPGICGYAATWQIREALGLPQLPAIATSATPLPEPEDTQSLGFYDFLIKPIEMDRLCEVVARCLKLEWAFETPRQTNTADATPVNPVSPRLPEPIRLHPELTGQHVLLAEDDEISQVFESKYLRALGLQVTVATNGKEVLEALQVTPFDVVLMDLQMPEGDGYETTRIIRQQWCESPIIIALTAHALPQERAKCLAAGMNDYLAKPFDLEQLQDMLLKWVRRKNPTSE